MRRVQHYSMAVICSKPPGTAKICDVLCGMLRQGAGDDVLVPRDFARRSPEILRATVPKT